MARVITRIKIFPQDINTNLDALTDEIRRLLPSDILIKAYRKDPIAFGLNALLVDFVFDDKEEQMDKLENIIKNINGVSEMQVINISRESSFKG